MNTEQQLRAEIARLNTLLDSVGAGGVGEGKLMPPAAQQSAAMPEFDRYEPGYDRDMVRCNNGGFVMFKKVFAAWPKGVV